MNKKAVRAIIFQHGKLLVMFRNKHGHKFYTLVGGQVDEGEPLVQTLIREVREETGLTVSAASEVFYEKHKPPFNDQHVFLCEIEPSDSVKIQEFSEEALLNRLGANIHEPLWVDLNTFERIPFRTTQLHAAILEGLRSGFPETPRQIG